jgi:hypothetical protein
MADLFARIKPKKSSTTGEIPSAEDLEVSELAVNTADGKLFTKHTDNTIKEISGGGGALTLDELTDVDISYALDGYQINQGNYLNAGEFQLNGSGLLIDKRSKNGKGNLPQPANDGPLWFSTSLNGPFTQLTIVGTVGTAGSNAYNISSFVDRSPLDAVLTGATVIYWHSVDPTTTPPNNFVLTYNSAASEWRPGGSTNVRTLLGINSWTGNSPDLGQLNNVVSTVTATGYQINQGSFLNPGEFQLNGSGLLIDRRSKNGLGNLPQPSNNGPLWFSTSPSGPFTQLTIVGTVGTSGSDAYNIPAFVDRSPLDAILTGATVVYWHSVNPQVSAGNNAPLVYSTSTSKWQPGTASTVRAILGIGEYATDAAAGSGGVPSGALYFNTTSSRYVLKA